VSLAVIGGGSWGTALSIHLARAGHAVRVWAREPEVVDGIRSARRNPWFLPDVDVPDGVDATTDLGRAIDGARVVIVAVPSEFVAATLKDLPPGEYTIEAWHERFGTRSQKVAPGPKETKEVEFAFQQG